MIALFRLILVIVIGLGVTGVIAAWFADGLEVEGRIAATAAAASVIVLAGVAMTLSLLLEVAEDIRDALARHEEEARRSARSPVRPPTS